MKPVASFKNNNKQSIDLTKDGLDYSKLYQDRTNEKKVFYKKNKKFYHKDAVYFSGHKFLGGPGAPGVLVAKRQVLPQVNEMPSVSGGGTVF